MMHEALKNFLHEVSLRRTSDGDAVRDCCRRFYHDTLDMGDPEQRRLAAIRLIAKMPTIAAAAYRYSIGWPIHIWNNLEVHVTRFLP